MSTRAAPEVSILVVSYNTATLTLACLDAIDAAAADTPHEVIVIDNASRDDTVARITAAHPAVQVVANPTNVGFARAVNQAADRATAPRLLLLNPDTVAEPHSIDAVVEFARTRPDHGLYGGRTLAPDGTVDPRSCWGRQSLWSLACFATMADVAARGSRLFDPESLGRWPRDTVREVDMITGCFLLVDTDVWNALGGFDEAFFMYGEDADLSLRARRAGYRPIITPDARVMHRGAGSPIRTDDKTILLLRARATILHRRWGDTAGRIGLGLLTTGVALRAAVARVAPVRAERRVWPEVWRRRREWTGGYPPCAATGDPAPTRPAARRAASAR